MTRVFVASNIPTAYPFKLQKPSTVNQRVRDTAELFIMDSGIGDDVSNAEVLDLAHEYDAEFVIAKDYLHDQPRTTDSVREFMDLYADHECEAWPLVPLQPPYDEHYQQLSEFGWYVLGGMAMEDIDAQQQLEWIRDFRTVAPGAFAHGLGVGGGFEFVRRAAGENLLDSVDCSTPEQAAMFGKVLDRNLRQKSIRAFESGDGARKRNTPLAGFNSWQVQDVWNREANSGYEQATIT